jgi:nicotinamidase-related amidase
MSIIDSKTCLLVIDMQKEYFEKGRPLRIHEGQKVLQNVKRLITFAREKNIPIIHIRHTSRDPFDQTFSENSPYVDFVDGALPKKGERVVTKHTPGSFYETELDQILIILKIKTLIICGLTSFLCCYTTSREAQARGYKVLFIKDAAAALPLGSLTAQQVHDAVCTIQSWYFAKVINTDEILK